MTDNYNFVVQFLSVNKFLQQTSGMQSFSNKIAVSNVIKVTVPNGSDFHGKLFTDFLESLKSDEQIPEDSKMPLFNYEEKRGPILRAKHYYFKASVPMIAAMLSKGIAIQGQFEVVLDNIKRSEELYRS